MNATGPLWKNAQIQSFPQLKSDELVLDVAVIGAGITGLTCAYLLKQAGKRVAVFESQEVGDGASGRTTAHLTEVTDERFHTLVKGFGVDRARAVAEAGRHAINQIERLVTQLNINCDFERVPGYLFAENSGQLAELQAEHEACAKIEVNAQIERHTPLPFTVKGALRFDQQAQFHPLLYLAAVASAIPGNGSFVFEKTPMVEIEDGEPCLLRSRQGRTVSAAKVVMATHSPLNKLFLQTKIARYQTYAVAGPAGDAPQGLFWDMESPYHYLRSANVDDQRYVIVGGEDHKTGQSVDTVSAFDRLTDYARGRQLLKEVTHCWSSQVVETVDGLPFIGRNSASKNVWVATGFSGNGMTFGTLAAVMLADAVLGRVSPYAELFEATRFRPMASLGAFVSENVDFPVKRLSGVARRAEGESLDDVAPGEGKMVRLNHETAAVYREPNGQLHAVSSVCTHMGCRVAFNSAATTWDCPCHGSRFSVDGEVLAGPAVKPLKRVELEQPSEEGSAHI